MVHAILCREPLPEGADARTCAFDGRARGGANLACALWHGESVRGHPRCIHRTRAPTFWSDKAVAVHPFLLHCVSPKLALTARSRRCSDSGSYLRYFGRTQCALRAGKV